MAGNRVKTRVLMDDPHCYSKTGIPRGNPKRYTSGNVICMGHTGAAQHPHPEDEKVETEGERQLKRLAKRQLETDVTIKEQLQRKRDFTGVTIYKPLGLEASGSLSLTDYKDLTECDAQIDQLRHCGLTEEEIRFKLASEQTGVQQEELGSSASGTKQARLHIINQKISKKVKELAQPTVFRGALHMSRHEQQLEASISHDPEKSKLLSCLLTSKQPRDAEVDFIDPSHPMNNLNSIMQDILGSGKQPAAQVKTSNTLHHLSKQNATFGEHAESDDFPKLTAKYECCENCDRHNSVKRGSHPYSDWEPVPPRDAPLPISSCANRSQEEPQTKSLSNFVYSTPGAPKALVGHVESVPEEQILKYRLSAEEIMKLPRFEKYTPGDPSKTLYLKNLSSKVTHEDLVSLFIRYQKTGGPQIVFKLMTGRMRGQAFVTLDSVETATKALELLNGYKFKDRPIIIEYGKNKDSPAKTY